MEFTLKYADVIQPLPEEPMGDTQPVNGTTGECAGPASILGRGNAKDAGRQRTVDEDDGMEKMKKEILGK